jgi:formylmethanofuran dehydrogenase subunit C
MFRGTIVSLKPLQLLPTFSHEHDDTPAFLRVFAKELQPLGVTIPHEPAAGTYRHYAGDASVPGKGEILVWQPKA